MLGLPELGGERGDRLLGFLSRDVLSRGDLPLLLLLPRLPLRRRPRWELCCSFFRHDLFLLQWPLDPEEELELSESEALSSLGRDGSSSSSSLGGGLEGGLRRPPPLSREAKVTFFCAILWASSRFGAGEATFFLPSDWVGKQGRGFLELRFQFLQEDVVLLQRAPRQRL